MKKSLFIKHDPRIKKKLGCDRATLLLDRLEFYFSRQPDGFYKFIEPNSHKLYKKEDSWTELLGCHRTSFWRAFNLIGKKHSSKWNFDKSKDVFEGKLYACYYDRLTNRMFFIRNKKAVAEFFDKIGIQQISNPNSKEAKENSQPDTKETRPNEPVRTEHNDRSYNESNHTSKELFKNNSHASEEIIKKMIDIWVSTVQEGRGQVELRSKRIAFLKKAFKDKFDSSLDKWKKYCTDITRSQYLMGEKASTSWKVDLDWALKFQSIQNIFDGKYGIGDRG